MIAQLDKLYADFTAKLSTLSTQSDVLNLKSEYMGKKGPLTEVLKGLKDATPDERQKIGPKANEIKQNIGSDIQAKLDGLEVAEINAKLALDPIDTTITDNVLVNDPKHGGLHPITAIQQEVEDIFLSMGFDILDGPHVEDEFHNFEALNIPADHPARDMQDTFWFHGPEVESGKKALLRTHTSTIQIRGMMSRKPPFKFIAPGKVFRCERTDASHEMVFHQLEGMMVGKDVSVANLIYFMKTLLREIFKTDVEVRLRPGFFPFVEPGFELDIRCLICKGEGCSVCKQTGWVELLPCGMVHPNVLRAGGINSDEYNGFAFGLGLDRLVMMRYGIDDIRHIHGADLRFMRQFGAY